MDTAPRRIAHIDMDAFYASVEQRDNPSLRGKPVIVAGLSPRGVVCAASYEARRFGIHSAMPTQQARLLCKNGIFLRPRMERYREVSRCVFGIIREFSDVVEPVSVDECYVDFTTNRFGIDAPDELAGRLKQQIRDQAGLTCSVGIAPNKFIAKIASDFDKPDGLVVIAPDQVDTFLVDLPVGRIPGVGPVAQRKFQQLGVKTIAELRRLTREQLERLFRRAGGRLYEYARGIDERPVVTYRAPKSLSREQTFERDTTDLEVVRETLRRQADSVAQRLAKRGLRAHGVELKVKYDDFQQVTRSGRLDDLFNDADTIYQTALTLLERTEAGRRAVRLVGVGVSGLIGREQAEQLDFFE
jgi:DNA polymerase-4